MILLTFGDGEAIEARGRFWWFVRRWAWARRRRRFMRCKTPVGELYVNPGQIATARPR